MAQSASIASRSSPGNVGLTYFTPFRPTDPARARGCLTCTNFHGQFYAAHLLCEHNGGRHVVAVPREGCAFWEREPGSDDE